MLIESRDSSTMNLAEVWFSCNDMDSSYRSDTVYAIHCSGETNYPYFRSLVEYNTFDPNSLCTTKSYNEPINRYIGESTTIQAVSLAKVIFPAFLRQQGYRYAYIYSTPQLENSRWYCEVHTGSTACKDNWVYKLYDDDPSNLDYDMVVQFSSTIDENIGLSNIITCIHTSNFSQPHMTQVTRVGTQENYGNVLSANSFMTLAGTMNGFISGNMLVAEDFSMRYIGDQLLLTDPSDLSVCFYYNGGSTSLNSDGTTCTMVPLPGDAGCYFATITPANATSLEVNPYVASITVMESGVEKTYDYAPGCCYYGCIAIDCRKNNTEFTFIVNGGLSPVNIRVGFKSVGNSALGVAGTLAFDTITLNTFCWRPSNRARVVQVPLSTSNSSTTGYTLYYPNVNTNLLTHGTEFDDATDIVMIPEDASCKELQWQYNDTSCILGGLVEKNEKIDSEKSLIWTGVFGNTTPYVYVGCYTATSTTDPTDTWDYHVWKNNAVVNDNIASTCLYSQCNCFKDTVELYYDTSFTRPGPNGYVRNSAFIPQSLNTEEWIECLQECTDECGYVECHTVKAMPLTFIDDCWAEVGACDLCFTYAPESIEVNDEGMRCIGKDSNNNNIYGYVVNCFWPGSSFDFNWKTTPTIEKDSETYSLTYCSARAMDISLCDQYRLKVSGCISGTNDIDDYTDQCAAYTLVGDVIDGCSSVIENGEWVQFRNYSSWAAADLGIGTINMCLCNNTDISAQVYFTTKPDDPSATMRTCFYYASLQVETTDGSSLPDDTNPYLLSEPTLRLYESGVGQSLRIRACPAGSNSDAIEYTTSCSAIISVCYDESGPYWCKAPQPPDPSITCPELVPTVCLGICSSCHDSIYSQRFVVRPVYSVTSMSLKESAEINGREVTLCNGYFDGTTIYPGSSGEEPVLYLSVIKPLLDPVTVIIDDVEQDGWEIGPFIKYFPDYASHVDTDLTFAEDPNLPLPRGLNLVTRPGHGYITIDINDFDYGTAIINISMAGSQSAPLPFYVNTSGNIVSP